MTSKKLTRAQQIRRRQIAEKIIDGVVLIFWIAVGSAVMTVCFAGAVLQEQDKLREEMHDMITECSEVGISCQIADVIASDWK